MTSMLLKYVLKGALQGLEEYERMLEKEHMDPEGPMAKLVPPDDKLSPAQEPRKPTKKVEKPKIDPTDNKIDIDDLLEEIR